MIFQFRNKSIDFTSASPAIMGILNVTPDSFSDGGKFMKLDDALRHTESMINAGADIIDIGAESTKPGAVKVSADAEAERLIPVIEAVSSRFDTVISVDTYKAKTAATALSAGAEIINDVGGLSDEMLEVIRQPSCRGYVLTHTQGTISGAGSDDTIVSPDKMCPSENSYTPDILTDVTEFFMKKVELLHQNNFNNIILDPGFGFGKTLLDNYYLMNNLDMWTRLRLPILVGVSRKSMIAKVLPPDCERLSGTLALNTIALMKGASILRVHDVAEHHNMISVLKKLLESNG